MNAMTQPQPLVVISAYKQLSAVERDFVDRYMTEIERRAGNAGEPLRVFGRVIPADLYENSRGLLDRQIVLAAVSERILEISERSELTHWRVLKELQNVAFANMNDFTSLVTNATGQVERVIDLADANPDMMDAVSEIVVKELPRGGREIKLKLHDKLKALGMLMTYIGMDQTGNKYWQEQEAKQIATTNEAAAIDADATDQDASERWQQYLEGERGTG